MRSILVLAGGRATDSVVFDTALAVAKSLRAHLEFLHVRPDAGEAALYTPHVEFASGAALSAAMNELQSKAQERSRAALHHFETLCERECIDIAIDPGDCRAGSLAASWCEEHHDASGKITEFARHNDLVVIGRRTRSNGLPHNLVERLLMHSGRPVLIAAARAPRSVMGTVLVCWKETAEAARMLSATLPFLAACQRVVLAGVEEGSQKTPEGLCHLARRLAWDGITVETKWLRSTNEPAALRLEALADEISADTLMMGTYGRGPMQEMVFGGCTQHFLEQAERAVLMMH